MFAELPEAFAGGRALDEAIDFKRSRNALTTGDALLHCVLSSQRNVQILDVRHKLLKTFLSGLSLRFLPTTTLLLRKA